MPTGTQNPTRSDTRPPLKHAWSFGPRARHAAMMVGGIVMATSLMLPSLRAQADEHFGPLSGKPRAVDGDTLEFGFKRVDLYGADSLERFQKCVIAGQSTACGADAWQAITNLIDKTPVRCEMKAMNRYKRNMAVCRNANGADIGQQLITMGWAVARTDEVPAYAAAEQAAKAARRGAWAGKFIDPLKWRRGERLPEHAISIY